MYPPIRAPPSSGLFLATIYNQPQLAERKHVARYWSISAVPVNAHPSPLVITTKLASTILVVAVVRRRGSAGPALPLCLYCCELYRDGGQFIRNRYGAGGGQIWLNNVHCIGTETSITDCHHRGWGVHNCAHSDDVSVSCIAGIIHGGYRNRFQNTLGFFRFLRKNVKT